MTKAFYFGSFMIVVSDSSGTGRESKKIFHNRSLAEIVYCG